MGRRRRALLAGLGLAAWMALVGPGAGATYQVSACGAAGTNRSWEASTTHPTLLNVSQACPPTSGLATSGLSVVDALGGGLRTPVGAVAEWTFTAPAGTAVTRLDSLRWLFTSDGGWVAYIRTAEGQMLEVCQDQLGTGLSCRRGDLSEPLPLPLPSFLAMSSGGVSIGVTCTSFVGGNSCGNGLGIHAGGAGLHAATVTVTDPAPPGIAAIAGPLRDATVGWVRGRLELSVGATDVGGGVGALLVGVDGRPQADGVAVACDYTLPAPCPPAASATLGLDTATLPDGPHTITAIAQDATRLLPGGNTTASAGWTVRTDNTAPAAPAGLTVSAAIAGAPISASWTVPDQGPGAPIVGARWSLAPADGGTGASAGQVGPEGASSLIGLVAPRPGPWRLEVSLLDAAGNVGAPATIQVPVAAAPGPDGPHPVGSAPLTLRPGARARVIDGNRLVVAVNAVGVSRRISVVFRLGSRVIGRRAALVRGGVGVLRVLLPGRALGAPGPVRVSWRRAGVAEGFRSLRVRAPAPALRVIGRARLVDRRLVLRVVPHVWPRVARVRLVLGRRVLLVVGRPVPAGATQIVVPLRRLRPPTGGRVQLAVGRRWESVGSP